MILGREAAPRRRPYTNFPDTTIACTGAGLVKGILSALSCDETRSIRELADATGGSLAAIRYHLRKLLMRTLLPDHV